MSGGRDVGQDGSRAACEHRGQAVAGWPESVMTNRVNAGV